LNSDLTRIFRSIWHILSDVPGWSEPPLKLRIRRLIPIALPIGLVLLMLGWSHLVRRPQVERIRAGYAPLVALDADIRRLRIECSDQQAEDLATEAEKASRMILPSAEAAPAFLRDLRHTVKGYGWVATFKDYEPVPQSTDPKEPILFVPAAGKMKPANGNRKPFPSLLKLLSHFTESINRIDLTRLAIRVDEKTGPTVEMNFRIASRPTDEKAAQ